MNRLLFGQTTLLITVFFAWETSFLLFDFYFNRLTQFLTKKEIEIFLGPPPPLGPLTFSKFMIF